MNEEAQLDLTLKKLTYIQNKINILLAHISKREVNLYQRVR